MKNGKPNYDRTPFVEVNKTFNSWLNWESIVNEIKIELTQSKDGFKTVVIDTYQGVYDETIETAFNKNVDEKLLINTKTLFKTEEDILKMTALDVTDDEIFGYLSRLNAIDFLDAEKLNSAKEKLKNNQGIAIIYGPFAALLEHDPTVFIYADMPRWEIQQRYRNDSITNLGIQNKEERVALQYKRAYFVDWRVYDRHKKNVFEKVDYFLDTTIPNQPKMITGEALKTGLKTCINRPFRVVPFFDPGPWGGQWMRKVCDLDEEAPNYAWCFDCVPEENSLLLKFGDTLFETPSINLVFFHPKALLGEPVHARFGDEFPIRFDFLDTMDGGNLSLQVHPFTEFIQEKFGMHYTQDESYYLLDAEDDAVVYLGLNENTEPEELITSLKAAQETGEFNAERYIAEWKVKKHDHILIPAGTIHCSGKNSMVLEISATPYIFTFKLWDWGRLGLDGRPRPINIERGEKNIAWNRKATWCKNNLINQVTVIEKQEDSIEERTGLHEREFIETRRHWFTKKVEHRTGKSVNVINLVEGREVIVESPDGSFEPFIIHYAETFIIPANVDRYTIAPYGESTNEKCATLKAFVRY